MNFSLCPYYKAYSPSRTFGWDVRRELGEEFSCFDVEAAYFRPLPYRQCHDFDLELKAGPFQIGHFDAASETGRKVNDKLDFRLGNATTGTFSVLGSSADGVKLKGLGFREHVLKEKELQIVSNCDDLYM